MNFLSSNNFLGRFFNLVFDLVILHIIWLICSLPIFTIGASTTALFYAIMKRTRRDEGYITQNFFKSFKENFKQSTVIWLFLLLVGFILYADFKIGLSLNTPLGSVIIVATFALLIPYCFVLLYIFPVQAKFINPITANLKNALLMAISNLGYTVIMLIICASFILLLLSSRTFIGLFLFTGIALPIWILSNFFVIIFRKYLPDEYEEDLEATNTQGRS